MQKHEAGDGQRTPRAQALGAVALASLIVVGASGAQSHGGDDVRRETRLRPRAIFGRSYALDHVRAIHVITRCEVRQQRGPPRPAPSRRRLTTARATPCARSPSRLGGKTPSR